MTFSIDNAEKLRAVWPVLTNDQKQALFDDGTCDLATRSTVNAEQNWRIYDGHVALSSYVRAYGEKIAEAEDWIRVPISLETTAMIARLVLSREPAVLDALIRVNRGVVPPILDPIYPDTTPELPAAEDPETA